MGKYDHYAGSPTSFGTKGAVITPSEVDIPGEPKAIVCLTAGDLTIVPEGNADEDTLEFINVAAGYIPPFRVRRVTAASAAVASVLD